MINEDLDHRSGKILFSQSVDSISQPFDSPSGTEPTSDSLQVPKVQHAMDYRRIDREEWAIALILLSYTVVCSSNVRMFTKLEKEEERALSAQLYCGMNTGLGNVNRHASCMSVRFENKKGKGVKFRFWSTQTGGT